MRFLLAIVAVLFLLAPPVYAEDPPSNPEAEIAAAVGAPVDENALAPVPAERPEPPPSQSLAETDNPLEDLGAAVTGDGTSTWRSILGVIIVVVGGLLTKWLRSTSLNKAKAYEEQAKNAGQDTKQRIVARAKAYIWRRVAEIQEAELPYLAASVVRKQITADQLKQRLRSLGDRLIEDTVTYFDRQDIDVLAEFGKDQLVSWVRSAVDEISIFQKWPTAKVLVEGGAEAILAVGMSRAGDYYDDLRKKVVAGEAGGSGAEVGNTPEAAVIKKIEKAVASEFEPAPVGA